MATQTTQATQGTTAENTITATGTIAVLPPCLLWLASVTASDDNDTKVLTSIDIRRTDNGMIRITSTDGHRCTRIKIPQSDNFFISQDQTAPFRLKAEAFHKLPSKKRALCAIDSGGLARVTDATGKLIEAVEWSEDRENMAYTYPNIDQLWPEDRDLTCNPGKLVAFNAKYFADCCSAAQRLTGLSQAVKLLTTENSLAPLILRWDLDLRWLLCNPKGEAPYYYFDEDAVTVETLIMPIQIRN